MGESLLKGRLIKAGIECPFSGICPDAVLCNRPKNMALDFSCATARTFDRLQMGGSFSQAFTVDVLSTGSATSRNKDGVDEVLEELNALPDKPQKKGSPKRRPKASNPPKRDPNKKTHGTHKRASKLRKG